MEGRGPLDEWRELSSPVNTPKKKLTLSTGITAHFTNVGNAYVYCIVRQSHVRLATSLDPPLPIVTVLCQQMRLMRCLSVGEWQITRTNKIASNARYRLFSRRRTSPTARQYRSAWPCQPCVRRFTHFTHQPASEGSFHTVNGSCTACIQSYTCDLIMTAYTIANPQPLSCADKQLLMIGPYHARSVWPRIILFTPEPQMCEH